MCYCKQYLFTGMVHCYKQHWVLGYPKPPTEPGLPLAVQLSVLEAPFNPELSGAPPSYNNLPCSVETPQYPQVGGGFWSFPLITSWLHLFKALSTFWEKTAKYLWSFWKRNTLWMESQMWTELKPKSIPSKNCTEAVSSWFVDPVGLDSLEMCFTDVLETARKGTFPFHPLLKGPEGPLSEVVVVKSPPPTQKSCPIFPFTRQ